jgi:hypothetical protein
MATQISPRRASSLLSQPDFAERAASEVTVAAIKLQIELFQTFDRVGQVHLLHLAENDARSGTKMNAAADLFQHILGQGAAHDLTDRATGARGGCNGAGADFGHAAGRALEQQDRRLGRSLLQPTAEFLDEG